MNGFPTRNGPSLNGLRRFDGATSVSTLNGLAGEVQISSSDPSFSFQSIGDENLRLVVPFTTVDNVMSTNKTIAAAKLSSTAAIDAPLQISAGENITIDRVGNSYTLKASANIGVDWASIVSKPSTFPPSTHGHVIAHTTGLQSALDSKAASVHGHVIADTTGLQSALDSKAASVHGHVIADTTGLQSALDSKAASVHGHVIADTTGLQSALDSKAASVHGHVIAHTTGLQSALDSKAASVHAHVIADTTGLQSALDSKAALVHGHVIAHTTGLQSALDSKASLDHEHTWTQVTGKPERFPSAPFGTWEFVPHPAGYLNLTCNGLVMFRFLADPVNVFARVCKYSAKHNGSWSISK